MNLNEYDKQFDLVPYELQFEEAMAWFDECNIFNDSFIQKFFNREFTGHVLCPEYNSEV